MPHWRQEEREGRAVPDVQSQILPSGQLKPQLTSGGPFPPYHWPEHTPNSKESRESEKEDFPAPTMEAAHREGIGSVYRFPQ